MTGTGEDGESPRSTAMVRATASLTILALALAGVALFAMGAGSIEAARDSSQFDRVTPDAATGTGNWTEGEEIYVATCDTCHGAGGPGAPSFKTVPLENTPGTGEAAHGPTAAALANAIADATGVRLREVSFPRRRVKTAIGV